MQEEYVRSAESGKESSGVMSCMWGKVSEQKINPNWILLDSQSMVDLVCNSDLLSNPRDVRESLNIHYNAGNITTNMVDNLHGYGTV